MARQTSAEELKILKESFDEYDTDNGGSISVEEFAKAMKASGQSATTAEVQQIIDEVDRDGDGTIDFQEFVAMMTGQPIASKSAAVETVTPAAAEAPEVGPEAEYKSAWKEFDPSLNGSITAAQFRQVMAGLGENVSDAEVDEIINSVDGEDKISYKEFVQFAKSKEVGDILDGYA